MDITTKEGRSAYIAQCEQVCKEQAAEIEARLHREREFSAELSALCAGMAEAINRPVYDLIRDIKASMQEV